MDNKKGKLFKYKWRDAFASQYGPKPIARHVLHVLFSHMDNDGICYPSLKRISTMTGHARSCVSKYLNIAIKEGWIKKEKRKGLNNAWKRSIYRAVIPEKFTGVVLGKDKVVLKKKRVVLGKDKVSPHGGEKVVLKEDPNNSIEYKENYSGEKPRRHSKQESADFSEQQEDDIPYEEMLKTAPTKVREFLEGVKRRTGIH